jgi:hypothetical protein
MNHITHHKSTEPHLILNQIGMRVERSAAPNPPKSSYDLSIDFHGETVTLTDPKGKVTTCDWKLCPA